MLPHSVCEICLCDKVNRRIQQLDVVILQRGVLQDIPANLVVCQRGGANLDLNTTNGNSVSAGRIASQELPENFIS